MTFDFGIFSIDNRHVGCYGKIQKTSKGSPGGLWKRLIDFFPTCPKVLHDHLRREKMVVMTLTIIVLNRKENENKLTLQHNMFHGQGSGMSGISRFDNHCKIHKYPVIGIFVLLFF